MPTDSSCVKISRDGAFVFATGTYPPRVKIYETAEVRPLRDAASPVADADSHT